MSLLQQVVDAGGLNHAVAVRFSSGAVHCVRAVMVTNNRLAPGQPVLQLRFACSCECGLPTKRTSAHCRAKCSGTPAPIVQTARPSTPAPAVQNARPSLNEFVRLALRMLEAGLTCGQIIAKIAGPEAGTAAATLCAGLESMGIPITEKASRLAKWLEQAFSAGTEVAPT